jgi:DNA-binding CsgD family transcriptional regulator
MTVDSIDRPAEPETAWRSVASTRPNVLEQAWRLTMTGQYAGWRAVADRLRASGRPGTDAALRDPLLRTAMDRVCAQAAMDAAALATHPVPDGPRAIPGEGDEAALWRIIEEQHQAFWSRDVARDAAYHVRTPDEMMWSWAARTGISIQNSWGEIEASMCASADYAPEPNPFFARRVERRNRTTRVRGDIAWVTFEEVYPTDDLPAFRGPGGAIQELRILEREEGVWKIAFFGILDDQTGQTATPMWQVDRAGRVLWQNAAALAYIKPDAELQMRVGRLRMRDAETEKRFRHALETTSEGPDCLFTGADLTPVVFDPDDGQPVRVWWVRARSGKLFVSVNDPELFSRRLSLAGSALRLTPAQQRLIFSIGSGLTLDSAAQREGVRLSTARTQLQRTYDKLGVRSQAALMRALFEATGA